MAVSLSAKHGFSKQPQPSITLISGEGIEGDAHCGRTVQHLYHMRKDSSRPNLSQVHLFPVETLEVLTSKGFRVFPGAIGENILTRDLDLYALPKGTLLGIGTQAVLEITGLRTPCSKIDRFEPGLQAQLWGKRDASGRKTCRAGIMAIVHDGGRISPGDVIHVRIPPEPHTALRPL